MRYKKFLPGNKTYCGITQSGRETYIFGTSMISKKVLKQKKNKLNNKLQRASSLV